MVAVGGDGGAGGVIGGFLDASAQGVVAVADLEVVLGVFGLVEPSGTVVGEDFVSFA